LAAAVLADMTRQVEAVLAVLLLVAFYFLVDLSLSVAGA
jgi:hypothetical protein